MHTDGHGAVTVTVTVTVTKYGRGSAKARPCQQKEVDGGRSFRKFSIHPGACCSGGDKHLLDLLLTRN
jgi:hypothetical protein